MKMIELEVKAPAPEAPTVPEAPLATHNFQIDLPHAVPKDRVHVYLRDLTFRYGGGGDHHVKQINWGAKIDSVEGKRVNGHWWMNMFDSSNNKAEVSATVVVFVEAD
jgi:hypothetical protein